MISKKHNFTILLSSVLLTISMVMLPLVVYSYAKAFGTRGKENIGLRYNISTNQTALQKRDPVKIIEDPIKIKDIQKVDISIKSKKKIKKKPKKKLKKKKKEIKQQKSQKAKKQVFDKGTIGELNLIYTRILQSSIKRNMIKPLNLQTNKKVHVRFRINGDGYVTLLNVHKSSGEEKIDELAMNTVRNASPFQKPPIALRSTDMTYIIPMIYKL